MAMSARSKTGKKLITKPTNKDRVDRTAQAQVVFDEFIANANAIDSVILMLSSDEEQLILKSFYHLDKFAMKYIGNYRELYERKLLPAIFRHIDSPHRFTRRFAMKILSSMFVVPEAKEELLENYVCYDSAMRTYTEVGAVFFFGVQMWIIILFAPQQVDDDLLMEYSAVILNELTENPVRMEAILGNPLFFKILFPRIPTTTDADVLHESLRLMYNILKCPEGLETLCAFQADIPFSFLLTATKSEYTKIQQCALDVLQLLCGCQSAYISSRYKDPLFYEDVFFILEVLSFLSFILQLYSIKLVLYRTFCGMICIVKQLNCCDWPLRNRWLPRAFTKMLAFVCFKCLLNNLKLFV